MKATTPMPPAERRERDAALLAAYCREIKRYRAQWGISTDRQVHLATWEAVRRETTH